MVDVIGSSYLSESDERDIVQAWADGLDTDVALEGRAIYVDRHGEVIGPMDIVVRWANREADATSGMTNIVTTEGELHGRPGELDQVQSGDLFVIDDQTAEVVEPIVTDRGVVRAPFRLMAGGR